EKDLLWQELDETAERMSSLSFTDTIVEREKSRVIAEVRNMFTGNPRLAAMNNARERAMPSHSAGRKGGHPDEIRNLKIGDIETHWKNYYKPENAVLVVAGGFDAFDAKVKINDLFSDIEPGEDVPDASQFGPVSKGRYKRVRVSPQLPGTSSHVCLAYRAPTMDDELYAPFLVLTVRMWLLAARIQFDPSQFPPPVYYAPLDDPDVFYVNTPVGIYESRQAAVRRIEAFVNESMSAELEPGDVMTTMDFFGPFLGFADLPEEMLAQNLYGLTFSLGRSEQLGLEPDKLRDAIENVTDRDLRRAATKTFSTDNRAAVIATVSKGRL
ncbi:MAG: insulinase family protein, partial [Candidatus Lindowbacteria bacterium]|nr:insulinase family protein [Candidatus Lindowbacteria bacterium]